MAKHSGTSCRLIFVRKRALNTLTLFSKQSKFSVLKSVAKLRLNLTLIFSVAVSLGIVARINISFRKAAIHGVSCLCSITMGL